MVTPLCRIALGLFAADGIDLPLSGATAGHITGVRRSIELGGDPGMHKNVLAATPNETAASGLFGNPLVGGSSLARPTYEYHVTGASPGLNRVFRLLPQGLRSAASVAEPTDLPRV